MTLCPKVITLSIVAESFQSSAPKHLEAYVMEI